MASPLFPFDILGVTLTSTPHDVRQAYYRLALIAHPDRGGSDDQMRVIHAAYVYVQKQIEFSAGSLGRTLDTEQRAFDEFLRDQLAAPAPDYENIRDIEDVVYQREAFSRLWESTDATDIWAAAVPGGYGDLMAPSGTVEDAAVATTTPLPSDFGPQTLVRYMEPEGIDAYGTLASSSTTAPPVAPFLDDYGSVSTGPDYRRAFQAADTSPPPCDTDPASPSLTPPSYAAILRDMGLQVRS